MSLTVKQAAGVPAQETTGTNWQAARDEPALHVRITLEVVLYLVLAVLALVLRLAQLGDAPLNDAEARQALAALQAVRHDVPGAVALADSPLTFALNALSFTFLPASDWSARLPLALGGVLLALSPALWRRYLMPLPPLIISLLLTISPVAGLAARTLSPAVWSLLLAVVAPWLVLRFVESRARGWAVGATVAFAALILLAEPAGFLAMLGLAFGFAFAWLTEDDPESNVGAGTRDLVRAWPWASGALAAAMVVVVVATLLFWLPVGLTTVGNALYTGLEGFVRRTDGAPVAWPLWVALRYEIGIVLFGVLGCYRAVREGGFFERVLAGWFLAGLVWSLIYSGASAAHALWITLPLTVLVGLMITRWITEPRDDLWPVPAWGVAMHSAITLGLWLAVGLSVVLLGKLLLNDLPPGVDDLGALVDTLTSAVYTRNSASVESVPVQDVPVYAFVLGHIQLRLLITVLVAMLIGILYFLFGSVWGARTAWRGLALGTLAFLLLTGFGVGWRTALVSWDDPRELWMADPVTDDVHELRATLREMSLRDNGEPNMIALTAQVPQNGALHWALRDFPNTVFVNGVGPEVATAAVILPVGVVDPALGGEYIGKDLIISEGWDLSLLSWRDVVRWYYRGDSQVKPAPDNALMLWVRKDVYGVEQVPAATEE